MGGRGTTDKKIIEKQTEEVLGDLSPTLQVIVRESRRLRKDIGKLDKTIGESNTVMVFLTSTLALVAILQFGYIILGDAIEALSRISGAAPQIILLGLPVLILVNILILLILRRRRNRSK